MDAHTLKWQVAAPISFLVLWSLGYVAAKWGLEFIEPFTFLSLRFGLVVGIMFVLLLILRPPLPKDVKGWGHLAIVGFLIQGVYLGMCYLSFNSGMSVGSLALILALQLILTGLIAPRWSGEHVGWRNWIGLILGLMGAGIVIVARSEVSVTSLTAIAFALLALCGITGGSLWEKRFGVNHHPVTFNFVAFIGGFVAVAPFMMTETQVINWTPELIGCLAFLVTGSSLLGVGLLLAMIRVGEVSKVSALMYLVPPLAAAFAWLIIGEIMPPIAWVGMAIAALGVFLATRKAA